MLNPECQILGCGTRNQLSEKRVVQSLCGVLLPLSSNIKHQSL